MIEQEGKLAVEEGELERAKDEGLRLTNKQRTGLVKLSIGGSDIGHGAVPLDGDDAAMVWPHIEWMEGLLHLH